jgi:hypothetical protein
MVRFDYFQSTQQVKFYVIVWILFLKLEKGRQKSIFQGFLGVFEANKNTGFPPHPSQYPKFIS